MNSDISYYGVASSKFQNTMLNIKHKQEMENESYFISLFMQ